MKPIEGLDLSKIFEQAENDALAEKRLGVHKQVSGIILNLQQWKSDLARAEAEWNKTKKKLGEKIEKAEGKLTQIKAGVWSVLGDDNEKKQGEPAEAD